MMFAEFTRRVLPWGRLTIVDADGRRHEVGGSDGPAVTIRLHDRALHRRLALNPLSPSRRGLYGGHADDRAGVALRLHGHLRRRQSVLAYEPARPCDSARLRRCCAACTNTTRCRARRRNVAHHYDLSDSLYELFLDRDRQYSCGYFTHPHDDLEQAQHGQEAPSRGQACCSAGRQRVLDIGSGWGGLALSSRGSRRRSTCSASRSPSEQLKVARRAGPARRARRPRQLRAARLPRADRHFRPDRLGRHVRACRRPPLRRRSSARCAIC